MHQFEHVHFGVHLLTTGNHDRYRTAFHDFLEIISIIGLDNLCAQFGSYPAAQSQVSGIPHHILTYCCHCHHRHAIAFAFVYQVSKIHQGLVFVLAAYIDGHGNGCYIQSQCIFH